jgi:adenylate kinase family enzyme
MKIVLIGPPCSGKSTIGAWLNKQHRLPFISMGQLYRDTRHTLPADTVRLVEGGGLLSDQECMQLLFPALARHRRDGWVLDGFPRTVKQAESIVDLVDRVFSIRISEAETMDRMKSRFINPDTGQNLFAATTHGAVPNIQKRSDDTLEALAKRLKLYKESVEAIERILHPKLTVLTGSDSHQNYASIVSAIPAAVLAGKQHGHLHHINKSV